MIEDYLHDLLMFFMSPLGVVCVAVWTLIVIVVMQRLTIDDCPANKDKP